MKFFKSIVLIGLLLLITIESKGLLRRNQNKTKIENKDSPFNEIQAKVTGGGKNIRVYNKDGHRIGRLMKDTDVILTGEIKIMDTTHGKNRSMHRMREKSRNVMIDLKTSVIKDGSQRLTGTVGEMWIATEHLTINYPKKQIPVFNPNLDEYIIRGTKLSGTKNDAACWNLALTGTNIVDTPLKLMQLYDNLIDEVMDGSEEIVKIKFVGLKAGWSNYLDNYQNNGGMKKVTQEARTNLSNAANLVKNTVATVVNANTKAFHKAMLRVAAEYAGYVVLPDGPNNDRYQLHMESVNNFQKWDHWGVSVKLGDNKRSYIQKVPGEYIRYNGNYMWDYFNSEDEDSSYIRSDINILSLKRELFDKFESN